MDLEEIARPLLDIKRTVKFTGTSLLGLGLETAILMLLVEFLQAPLLAGKLVGAEASIATMFLLNNRFTYKGRPGRIITRFLKSNLVRTGGIVIGMIVLKIGVHYGIWYPVANIAGVCVGFVFNYGLETAYTWKEHDQ